jgi:polyhydroxyalkanoate depolymerase
MKTVTSFQRSASSDKRLQARHAQPAFSLMRIRVVNGGKVQEIAVSEEAVHSEPFGTLLHFKKEGISGEPRVLLVAPMSGHFAARETVVTMLARHDVYTIDWHNAREVPRTAGRFGLDEYVRHLVTFLRALVPPSTSWLSASRVWQRWQPQQLCPRTTTRLNRTV